jgi:tetratricopeptide (TPR) repeat protein
MEDSARIGQLLQLLESEPEDIFLNYALALEYAREAGRQTEAEKQLLYVLRLDNAYIPAYYQLGQLYASLQRTGEALAHYQTGLEKAREQKNNKAINEFGEAIFLLED